MITCVCLCVTCFFFVCVYFVVWFVMIWISFADLFVFITVVTGCLLLFAIDWFRCVDIVDVGVSVVCFGFV